MHVPVGLVEKDPTKGTFCMIQHYSKEDPLGVSVNSQLDSDDFLTCWNSAYTMANYVSGLFLDTHPLFSYYLGACAWALCLATPCSAHMRLLDTHVVVRCTCSFWDAHVVMHMQGPSLRYHGVC